MSISNTLFKIGRQCMKTSAMINDIKVILTGDPEKIIKRFARKEVNKTGNKIIREINNKIK